MLRLITANHNQPKLTVSNPGDSSEREADRVADQVMRMTEPTPGVSVQQDTTIVQLSCIEGQQERRTEDPNLVQAKNESNTLAQLSDSPTNL